MRQYNRNNLITWSSSTNRATYIIKYILRPRAVQPGLPSKAFIIRSSITFLLRRHRCRITCPILQFRPTSINFATDILFLPIFFILRNTTFPTLLISSAPRRIAEIILRVMLPVAIDPKRQRRR
jgi:hypothetical protein